MFVSNKCVGLQLQPLKLRPWGEPCSTQTPNSLRLCDPHMFCATGLTHDPETNMGCFKVAHLCFPNPTKEAGVDQANKQSEVTASVRG